MSRRRSKGVYGFITMFQTPDGVYGFITIFPTHYDSCAMHVHLFSGSSSFCLIIPRMRMNIATINKISQLTGCPDRRYDRCFVHTSSRARSVFLYWSGTRRSSRSSRSSPPLVRPCDALLWGTPPRRQRLNFTP